MTRKLLRTGTWKSWVSNSRRSPPRVEFLVIDHIEKPSENRAGPRGDNLVA